MWRDPHLLLDYETFWNQIGLFPPYRVPAASDEALRNMRQCVIRCTPRIYRERTEERAEEIVQALKDLYEAGTDIVTITQYLRPSVKHHPVTRWVKPQEFVELKNIAEEMGFLGVLSGPLVRSSYRAGRLWAQSMMKRGEAIPEDLQHLADAAIKDGYTQAVK